MAVYPNESEDYRKARNELLKAELGLRAELERVAAMRRTLPPGGVVEKEYEFKGLDSEGTEFRVGLGGLFQDGKKSLLVYNYMYGPEMENSCPLCTAFLDSISGHVQHITQRMNLAIVAKSPIRRIKDFAATRNWEDLPLFSSGDSEYNRDYHGEDADGNQWPMANVFVKDGDEVRHFWGSEMLFEETMPGSNPRHVDLIWPLWNFFDLTPEGRGDDWFPGLSY